MSRLTYLLARAVWTVIAVWLVFSGTFFLFAYTPDPNENLVEFGAGYTAALSGGNVTAAQKESVEAYREAREYDKPIFDRYRRWMAAYATFDWGVSYRYGKPVSDVIRNKGLVTLLYLAPAAVIAVVLGTLIGLFSAMRERSGIDYLVRSLSYLGLGIPNFWFAGILVLIGVDQFGIYALSRWNDTAPTSPDNYPLLIVAGVVVGVHILAIQVRYARSETRTYRPELFVKVLRSAGAGESMIARHVLRSAALPLVTLLFTEVLVAAMIDVFIVEVVLDIPGLGTAAYEAITNRDIGLILGTWLLPMILVLGGSFCQDAVGVLLDPRILSDGN